MSQRNTQPTVDGVFTIDSAAAILHGVVHSLVSAPDAVEVAAETAANQTRWTLRVAPHDLATVMGPAQRTYRSLLCIVKALGRRSGQRFALDCQAVEAFPGNAHAARSGPYDSR